MNKNAGDKVTYKIIYLARHGQGVHNVVSLFVSLYMPRNTLIR